MKTLIVEDDFTSRLYLQELLKGYGPTHIAVNGKEAIEATHLALEAGEPYNLICLDIMMPEMDGQHVSQGNSGPGGSPWIALDRRRSEDRHDHGAQRHEERLRRLP